MQQAIQNNQLPKQDLKQKMDSLSTTILGMTTEFSKSDLSDRNKCIMINASLGHKLHSNQLAMDSLDQ